MQTGFFPPTLTSNKRSPPLQHEQASRAFPPLHASHDVGALLTWAAGPLLTDLDVALFFFWGSTCSRQRIRFFPQETNDGLRSPTSFGGDRFQPVIDFGVLFQDAVAKPYPLLSPFPDRQHNRVFFLRERSGIPVSRLTVYHFFVKAAFCLGENFPPRTGPISLQRRIIYIFSFPSLSERLGRDSLYKWCDCEVAPSLPLIELNPPPPPTSSPPPPFQPFANDVVFWTVLSRS